MASLENIKKRIKSIESTAKITFAMKMVATAKLQKFKKLFVTYQDYLEGYYETFASIFNDQQLSIEAANQTLFAKKHHQKNKTLYVVIGSDIGMCSGFNTSIMKKLKQIYQPNDQVYFFGSKIALVCANAINNLHILKNYTHIERYLNPEHCFYLAKQIYDDFIKNDYSGLKIIYTQFINNLTFNVQVFDFLPISHETFDDLNQKLPAKGHNLNPYELDADPEVILLEILPQFFVTLVYGAILESKVCESASRYNAMSTATDNADALKQEYKLEYNRNRQASITQEIIEIVSGSKQV